MSLRIPPEDDICNYVYKPHPDDTSRGDVLRSPHRSYISIRQFRSNRTDRNGLADTCRVAGHMADAISCRLEDGAMR